MSMETMTGQAHAPAIGAQDRMRALRAERLARLRTGEPAQVLPLPAPPTRAEPEAEAALREFLRALLGEDAPTPAPPAAPPPAPPAAPTPAPPAAAGAELARLPGAGPGLVAALQRAGLTSLAEVAALAPTELAARLGPIGRLVPAPTWVAAALAEASAPRAS